VCVCVCVCVCVIFLVIRHIGSTILNFENLKSDIKSSMIETLSSDHSCNGYKTPLSIQNPKIKAFRLTTQCPLSWNQSI